MELTVNILFKQIPIHPKSITVIKKAHETSFGDGGWKQKQIIKLN